LRRWRGIVVSVQPRAEEREASARRKQDGNRKKNKPICFKISGRWVISRKKYPLTAKKNRGRRCCED